MSQMTQTSDTVSETPAQRRARLRRQKILSDSDSRMKKILSINEDNGRSDRSDTFDGNCEPMITTNTSNTSNDSLLQELAQTANRLLNDNSINELRHRLNGNGIDWQTIQTSVTSESKQKQSIDRTFPRKVSLISTPIDYKTLQQSHQNNTTSSTSHLVWLLSQNQTKLSIICVLLSVAIISSLLRLNFVVPFGVTQLTRGVIVLRGHKNNGSNKRVANVWIALSVCRHLVIFVFTYISIQVFL